MTNRRGFTKMDGLVLVVILFIAAVLGLNLASRGARAKGYENSCLSSEKKLALSLSQYCTDHGDRFPLYDNHSQPGYLVGPIGTVPLGGNPVIDANHPSEPDFGALGMSYGVNCCTVACPADPRYLGDRRWGPLSSKRTGPSHSFNGLFLGVPVDRIAEPANKIIVIDECSITDFVFLKYTAPNYDLHALSEPANFVHDHGLNCLYVDGHAKWLSKDLWPLGGPITPSNKASAFLVDSKPQEEAP
jgi:prepilin-type processing-associated H-X9-DG protein